MYVNVLDSFEDSANVGKRMEDLEKTLFSFNFYSYNPQVTIVLLLLLFFKKVNLFWNI